jgi:hypothetical protein
MAETADGPELEDSSGKRQAKEVIRAIQSEQLVATSAMSNW